MIKTNGELEIVRSSLSRPASMVTSVSRCDELNFHRFVRFNERLP